MKDIKFIIIYLMLIANFFACNAKIIKQKDKMQISKLVYIDGSGNTYNITTDSISYIPITPEMSSSGFYNGGSEKHNLINKADYQNLIVLFDSIFKDKKIQIQNRIKTSGVLVRYSADNTSEEIIIAKSEKQMHLEDYLKRLLSE